MMKTNDLAGYVTREMLAARARAALDAKVRVDALAPADRRKGYSLDQFETPEYAAWIEKAVEVARAEGRLVTAQQYDDLRAGRKLAQGDRARYVGADREEALPEGRSAQRPHGQVGQVVNVLKDADGRLMVTFRPEAAVIAGDDELIVDLVVKEGAGYLDLERIPE